MLKKYVFVDIAYFGVNMQLRCLVYYKKQFASFLLAGFKEKKHDTLEIEKDS